MLLIEPDILFCATHAFFSSFFATDISGNHYGTWTGNFKVTNYSDENDIAYSPTITVKVYDDYQDFVEQKIKKSILSNANDDDSIFD